MALSDKEEAELRALAEELKDASSEQAEARLDKWLDDHQTHYNVRGIRVGIGKSKPFKKGYLCTQIMPKVQEAILRQVQQEVDAAGDFSLFDGRPFSVTMIVKEAFLLGIKPTEEAERSIWRGASTFKKDWPVETTIAEAFLTLEASLRLMEDTLEEGRHYKGELVAKFAYLRPDEKG